MSTTGRRYSRVRRVPAVLLAMALAVPAGPLEAQGGEAPTRVHRHLAVGNVGFLHSWRPTLQAGYLYQGSLRESRISVDEFGTPTVHPPQWFVHALLSTGWASDADGRGESGFGGLGQLGIMHRLREDGPVTISRIGIAAQASWGPRGFGPVARVGFLHGNAALSVGWMSFSGPRADGVVVTVDVLRCILQDLGLVDRCLVQ